MERVYPYEFKGPRAYFTDFDYKIVQFKPDKKTYRREVERRLKIILLTKNTVVCAASHFTHEFAYSLFNDNPILLDENMILPALRRDKDHVIDYLDRGLVRGSLKQNIESFYQDHVTKVVDWELMPNTTWFRQHLLEALSDDRSVVRRSLTIPKTRIHALIDELQASSVLFWEIISESVSNWDMKNQRKLLNFVNLVYHMSGAKTVNCEGALPEENYIDYNLTDFSRHKTLLSDTQVFLKLLFELAFEIMYKYTLPVELLDILAFEDIYYLRKPLENSSFRVKYDNLIRSSINAIRKTSADHDETLAYDIKESGKILGQISTTFEEIFTQELLEFRKKKQRERTEELRKSAISLGFQAAGLIPFVSTITNAISITSALEEFFVNVSKRIKSKEEVKDQVSYIREKEKTLHKLIEETSLSEDTVLLDALDLLVSTIFAKLRP